MSSSLFDEGEVSDLDQQLGDIRARLLAFSSNLADTLTKTPDEIIGGHNHNNIVETFESLEEKRDDMLDDDYTFRFVFWWLLFDLSSLLSWFISFSWN